MSVRLALCAVIVFWCCLSCHASTKIPVGIKVGAFFPSSEETRSLFGAVWPAVGLSPFSVGTPREWAFAFDISIYDRRKSGNHVFLIPLTVGVAHKLGSGDEHTPYVALRVGPYYGSLNAGTDRSGSRWGVNANLALGVIIDNRYYVETRYDWFGSMFGSNFSGFQFMVGVTLFEMRL